MTINAMDVYRNVNYDQYITDPKAYVGGMATDPPYPNTDPEMPGLTDDDSEPDWEQFVNINNTNQFDESESEIEQHLNGNSNINIQNEPTIPNQPTTPTKSTIPEYINSDIDIEFTSYKTMAHINTVESIYTYRDRYLDNLPGLDYGTDSSSEEDDDYENENNDFKDFDYGDEPEPLFVQTDETLPDEITTPFTGGVYNIKTRKYNNGKLIDGRVESEINSKDFKEEIIQDNNVKIIRNVFSSGKRKVINRGTRTFKNISKATKRKSKNKYKNKYNRENYDEPPEDVEDVYMERVEYIHDSDDQWFINIPIRYSDGTAIKTSVFADSGANAACVDRDWAFEHFEDSICKNKSKTLLDTPGGLVRPKYCLWMSFPTKTGKILKTKMYLVKNLPVLILADINMLKAFGYKFKDETPPVFRHDKEDDIELDLKDDNEILSNRKIIDRGKEINIKNYNGYNWYKSRTTTKNFQLSINTTLRQTEANKIRIFDVLKGDEKELYRSVNKNKETIETIENDADLNVINNINEIENEINNTKDSEFETIEDVDLILKEKHSENEILNIDHLGNQDYYIIPSYSVTFVNRLMESINDDKFDYHNKLNHEKETMHSLPIFYKMDRFGNSMGDCPIYHRCMFIVSRESFQANREEIEEAERKRKHDNKSLDFINFEYLKKYPLKYGSKYNNLYEAVVEWTKKNRNIFAFKTFDRKTMTVPYARLGIMEEHRDKTMFAPQYPINHEKRIDMINYTVLNEENGFWVKVKHSINCVPYTMVPKKKHGKIIRYRPAFDGRVVNQWCHLMASNMPTLRDFRELHSIKGLVTMADVKNCFDCIPLHPDDRKFAVAHTPLGLYRMNCLTYGWKNAAPEAQKIMNQVALHIGNTLAYIDDICIKHQFGNGTKGVINQLNKLAEICIKFNIQLNPSKFVPACDYSESFGFQNTMIGEMVSRSYQDKLLTITMPKTKSEVRTLDGMLNYVNNHIYNNKLLMYWINQLREEVDLESRKKRLVWTKQATLAWKMIRWLLANLPLLHHPRRDGQFCLQTDACNYGVGAVLWQQHYDEKLKENKWKIIDMWSKTMPQQLRHCHSMVHEAYAITAAIEHWQFYLIKSDFIVSTDNLPVANLFGRFWKYLNPITQKQLMRLRSKINSFSFSSYHVKGLKNPIADGLSRFTMKLIDTEMKKPPMKQDIPFYLEAITSMDTKTPVLTPQEKSLIKLAEEEGARLDEQLEKLKRDPTKYTNALQTHTYNILPYDNIHNEKLNNKNKNSLYESYKNNNDKIWNSFGTEYSLNTPHLKRK